MKRLISALHILRSITYASAELRGSWAGVWGMSVYAVYISALCLDYDQDVRADIWKIEVMSLPPLPITLPRKLAWRRHLGASRVRNDIASSEIVLITSIHWQNGRLGASTASAGDPLPEKDLRASLIQPTERMDAAFSSMITSARYGWNHSTICHDCWPPRRSIK